MKYFSNLTTEQEIKSEYRKLAAKLHPDMGGSHEAFVEMRNQYDAAIRNLFTGRVDAKEQEEMSGKFADIINQIINLDGIEIEVCGSWVWVTGNTYPVKDKLKEAKFKWAKRKKAWYWAGKPSRNRKGEMTLDQIRSYHGSKKIKSGSTRKALTA